MPIDPRIISSPGNPAGIAMRLGDIERQIDTTGGGGTYIGDGSLTGALIATNAIGGTHISANTITAGHITANSITAGHIQANTISAGHITAGAITAGHITAGSITAGAISANAITTEHLTAGSIVAGKIAAGAITSTLIAANTIIAGNIQAGAITSTLLASDAVTAEKIVTGAVTSTKINVTQLSAISGSMGTLTAGLIRIGAVNGAKTAIGNGISTSTGLKDGIVLTNINNDITFWADAATGNLTLAGTIAAGSTGLGNIAGQINGNTAIVDNTIPGGKLVIDSVNTRELAASAVTAVELAAGAVVAGKILAGSIKAVDIEAGAITASKIQVGAIGGSNLAAHVNTSFEDGTAPWFTGSTFFINAAANVSNPATGSPYGTKCLRFVTSGVPGSGVQVSITGQTFKANTTYTLSAWVSAPWFNYVVYLGWSADYASFTKTAQQAWHKITFSWTVGGVDVSNAIIAFADNTTGGTNDLLIDAVMVEEGGVATGYAGFGPGTLSSTQIGPGSITTGKIEATAIDTMTLTGTTLRTGATGERVEINNSGLFKYEADGVTQTVRIGEINGLDILSGTNAAPPAQRRLRWVDGSGAVVGEIASSRTGSASYIESVAHSNAPFVVGSSLIGVRDDAGNFRSYCYADCNQSTGAAAVIVYAGTNTGRTIINNAGGSSFTQVASDPKLKTNVQPMSAILPTGGAIGAMKLLTPRAFNWKPGMGEAGQQAGFMADEVALNYPAAATSIKDASGDGVTLGVLCHPIMALHHAAITELEARITNLERRP